MTLPKDLGNHYLSIKYFLNSYRAYSDGAAGIYQLRSRLESDFLFISDWKILWIGTCTILRTAIDLFRIDKNSCINKDIRNEIEKEWNLIRGNQDEHPIFWEFLRKERNLIIHEYEWSAYEIWLDPEGKEMPSRMSLLGGRPEDMRTVLLMRGGYYDGRDSLELLQESADWVKERIFTAIIRAGFDPEESRNLTTFEKRPPIDSNAGGVLGSYLKPDSQDDQ